MSKVAYIDKRLLSLFNLSISKNLNTKFRNASYSNWSVAGLKFSSILGLNQSLRENHKPVAHFDKVIENSIRQISCGQYIMCNTKEKATDFDEHGRDESNPVEESPQSKIEKELNEKILLLTNQVEDFKDKYQRALADKENLRQRLEKQISDSKLFGIQSFCKDLLEVSDIFRKALESVPDGKVQEADSLFISLYDGVVMTENQLLSVFRRHGLQRIVPTEGDKFDPSVQEAMFEVPASEGKLPGTVAHVIRTGWKLHDRCVRSAQVGVIKN